MSYQIETGIPTPQETDLSLLETLNALEVGQSVFVGDKGEDRITFVIIDFNREHNDSRTLFWSEVPNQLGFRIWRTT